MGSAPSALGPHWRAQAGVVVLSDLCVLNTALDATWRMVSSEAIWHRCPEIWAPVVHILNLLIKTPFLGGDSPSLPHPCFLRISNKLPYPESPLDYKIQPVHPKGDQSWVFIERTDDEAETPILWPPDAKRWLIGKDPDAGMDWRWEEKGTTED